MKQGYRIEIEKGLSLEHKQAAEQFADRFIRQVQDNGGRYPRLSGYGSKCWYKRGMLGLTLGGGDSSSPLDSLTFRRKVKSKRIFIICKVNNLKLKNTKINKDILGDRLSCLNTVDDFKIEDIKMCMCTKHKGGLQVSFRKEPETYIYYEEGDIKG